MLTGWRVDEHSQMGMDEHQTNLQLKCSTNLNICSHFFRSIYRANGRPSEWTIEIEISVSTKYVRLFMKIVNDFSHRAKQRRRTYRRRYVLNPTESNNMRYEIFFSLIQYVCFSSVHQIFRISNCYAGGYSKTL